METAGGFFHQEKYKKLSDKSLMMYNYYITFNIFKINYFSKRIRLYSRWTARETAERSHKLSGRAANHDAAAALAMRFLSAPIVTCHCTSIKTCTFICDVETISPGWIDSFYERTYYEHTWHSWSVSVICSDNFINHAHSLTLLQRVSTTRYPLPSILSQTILSNYSIDIFSPKKFWK